MFKKKNQNVTENWFDLKNWEPVIGKKLFNFNQWKNININLFILSRILSSLVKTVHKLSISGQFVLFCIFLSMDIRTVHFIVLCRFFLHSPFLCPLLSWTVHILYIFSILLSIIFPWIAIIFVHGLLDCPKWVARIFVHGLLDCPQWTKIQSKNFCPFFTLSIFIDSFNKADFEY